MVDSDESLILLIFVMSAMTQQYHVCKCLSAGVTIGLQQSDITVNESVGSVEICAVIKCGCIRRDIDITLDVLEDTAVGMQWVTMVVCTRGHSCRYAVGCYGCMIDVNCCWTPPQLNFTSGKESVNDLSCAPSEKGMVEFMVCILKQVSISVYMLQQQTQRPNSLV